MGIKAFLIEAEILGALKLLTLAQDMFARIWAMVNRTVLLYAARVLTLLVVAVLAAPQALARNAVSGLRLGSHPDGITRFVMDLGEGMDFSVMTVAAPNRVVVSTPGLSWGVPQHRPTGVVKGVRYEDIAGQGRIVVDLKDPALVKKLTDAFLKLDPNNPEHKEIMALQRASKFIPTRKENYDGIEKAAHAAGLLK